MSSAAWSDASQHACVQKDGTCLQDLTLHENREQDQDAAEGQGTCQEEGSSRQGGDPFFPLSLFPPSLSPFSLQPSPSSFPFKFFTLLLSPLLGSMAPPPSLRPSFLPCVYVARLYASLSLSDCLSFSLFLSLTHTQTGMLIPFSHHVSVNKPQWNPRTSHHPFPPDPQLPSHLSLTPHASDHHEGAKGLP